jgi:hypothetical protein
MPITEKQLAANRSNAAKSAGPRRPSHSSTGSKRFAPSCQTKPFWRSNPKKIKPLMPHRSNPFQPPTEPVAPEVDAVGERGWSRSRQPGAKVPDQRTFPAHQPSHKQDLNIQQCHPQHFSNM